MIWFHVTGSKPKEKKKDGKPVKRKKNAKLNNDDEAIEESDEGDFDDRELDYITDSEERFVVTVNVLKFRTLYSILFQPKFCFLCSCFLRYLIEWQTV